LSAALAALTNIAVITAAEVEMAAKNGRVVLVAGATGLVGREILATLLADKSVKAVHCVGRRPPTVKHP